MAFCPLVVFNRLAMMPSTPLVRNAARNQLLRRSVCTNRVAVPIAKKPVRKVRPCRGHRTFVVAAGAGTLAATRGTAAAGAVAGTSAGAGSLPSAPTGAPLTAAAASSSSSGSSSNADADGDSAAFDALCAAAGRALGPLAGQLTFGTCLGCCAGYALKSVGRSAALVVGVAFVGLQTLQFCGYIDINWGKVQKDVVHVFDKDGDGTVGRADLKSHWDGLMAVLRFNLPSSAGFGLGVALGIMYG